MHVFYFTVSVLHVEKDKIMSSEFSSCSNHFTANFQRTVTLYFSRNSLRVDVPNDETYRTTAKK